MIYNSSLTLIRWGVDTNFNCYKMQCNKHYPIGLCFWKVGDYIYSTCSCVSWFFKGLSIHISCGYSSWDIKVRVGQSSLVGYFYYNAISTKLWKLHTSMQQLSPIQEMPCMMIDWWKEILPMWSDDSREQLTANFQKGSHQSLFQSQGHN